MRIRNLAISAAVACAAVAVFTALLPDPVKTRTTSHVPSVNMALAMRSSLGLDPLTEETVQWLEHLDETEAHLRAMRSQLMDDARRAEALDERTRKAIGDTRGPRQRDI